MGKTILYILDYYLPHQWGVETVFEQIISRSLAKGRKVILLTSHFDPQIPKAQTDWNLSIIRTWKNRKTFILKAFRAGKKILKTHNIDLIHTSTYGGAIPASLLAKLFKKKILITVHEIFGKLRSLYKPRTSAWIFKFFERFLFQLPYDCYHCVSLYTLNALRIHYGISDHKLKLIHNGVDTTFRNPKKITQEEKKLITSRFSLDWKQNLLYFGHTGISKGIDTLVEAIPQLLKQFPNLQLIFNFIPAQRESFILEQIQKKLKKCTSDQQKRLQISHTLEKKQLRTLVTQVDGVIAPSLSEGFGSVHTETLALRTPLITTQIAAIPEVAGGKTLFISPQSVDELINAVDTLLKGKIAPLPEKHFDRSVQYEAIAQLYTQLLSNKISLKNQPK